jgi:hypothetical protein
LCLADQKPTWKKRKKVSTERSKQARSEERKREGAQELLLLLLLRFLLLLHSWHGPWKLISFCGGSAFKPPKKRTNRAALALATKTDFFVSKK